MLPEAELHFEGLVMMIGFGLLGFLFLTLAHYADRLSLGGKPEAEPGPEAFPGGLREGNAGVPVLLILLYGGLAIWAVLYVLAHALWGMDFGA
jgi:hypothetical protein